MRDYREPILSLGFLLLLNCSSCVHQQVKADRIQQSTSEKKVFSFQSPKKVQATEEADEETLADSTHSDLHSYFAGLQDRAQGNYEKAIQSFNQFLTENPDHLYSDRAQYLIVDSYYLAHEYQSAIVASYQMEKQYPESRKLPEALYKRALSHFEMGQQKQGLDTLQIIIEEFSKSAVSELAREKLEDPHAGKEHI